MRYTFVRDALDALKLVDERLTALLFTRYAFVRDALDALKLVTEEFTVLLFTR
jgi:hypothetical protein